mgnify:CR=1 FL=1
MKDYYDEYVKYATRLILNNDDYGNKSKVRAHNRAMKKLLLLEKEIIEANDTDLFDRLLQHEDERVKMYACNLCVTMNYNVDNALQILKELCVTSTEAPMILGHCMRFIQSNGTCEY